MLSVFRFNYHYEITYFILWKWGQLSIYIVRIDIEYLQVILGLNYKLFCDTEVVFIYFLLKNFFVMESISIPRKQSVATVSHSSI